MRRPAQRRRLARNIARQMENLIETVVQLRGEIEAHHARVRVMNRYDSEFHTKVEELYDLLIAPRRMTIGITGYACEVDDTGNCHE